MKHEKKPAKKGVKIACSVIVIIAVFACIAVLISSMGSKEPVPSSETNASGSSAKEEDKKEANTIGITDTLHAQSFDFTITSAKYYDSITNQLGVICTPDEGKRYLVLVIKADNTTNEDQNVENVNFNSYIDNSKITPESITGEVDGTKPLLGAVSAGKTFEGYTVWQVPQNWDTFTFSYIDALSGEDSDSFTLHSTDIK